MAVTRVIVATLASVSNQALTVAGVVTTAGAARPCKVTSVIVKLAKDQASGGFVKLWNKALSTDVNADHITNEPTLLIPFTTQAIGGQTIVKHVFPGGVHFPLGCQIAMDTTIAGNTAVSTTGLPEEVLVFWTEGKG